MWCCIELGVKSHSSLHLRPLSNTSDLPCTIPVLSFPPFVFSLFWFRSSLMLPLLHPNSMLPCLLQTCAPPQTLNPFCPDLPLLSELLYLNPLNLLIQTNLIITYHCVTPISSAFTYTWLILCLQTSLQSPLSDLCLTSVWLPSDSGLGQPFQNYRTYLHIVHMGTTHKLKPSPIGYPLLITC